MRLFQRFFVLSGQQKVPAFARPQEQEGGGGGGHKIASILFAYDGAEHIMRISMILFYLINSFVIFWSNKRVTFVVKKKANL